MIEKKDGMNVPGIIYASEELIKKIKEDKTFLQLTNVAKLKGIVKNAYAMPDAHEGYGFPIGGVAAFDYNDGIISPGGVGYDINCLLPDAKIQTGMGYTQCIKDIETNFIDVEVGSNDYSLKAKKAMMTLASFDNNKKGLSAKNALYFMSREHKGKIAKIKTKLGYEIKSTLEHPILTNLGMIEAGKINKGDFLAVSTFKGIEFEDAKKIIIDDSLIPKAQQDELFKRRLFPAISENERIGLIAGLFGYLLGDGNIYFTNNKGRICAYGKKEDMEDIIKDFASLGFSARIYKRERTHKIKTQYGEKSFSSVNHELHVSSSSLASLFFALGYPKGKKTSTDFDVPKWILDSPKWVKRRFLAGFFGAEMSTPKTHTKTGFDCPVISMNKNEPHVQSARDFMISIMRLLEEFEVSCDKISQREEFFNKQGKTFRVRLQLSSKEDNLINLYEKIGFEYNASRKMLSEISILYMKEKQRLTTIRSYAAVRIKGLKNKGLSLKETQKTMQSEYYNDRFVERHYYENAKQRITLSFPSFEDYKKEKIKTFKEYGLSFDAVESIETFDYDGKVYDLNIEDTHNFIADNIIVSNCGVRVMRTNLSFEELLKKRTELINVMFKDVPAGVGEEGKIKLSKEEFAEVCEKGSEWAIGKGFGRREDLDRTEENGRMPKADMNAVSDKAFHRGKMQVGTLGSGNHFLEIQKVDKIFDPKVAKAFGVDKEGQVLMMIHCGSRGFGHQVASDYIKLMEDKYGHEGLPDRELINAPFQSELGQKYYQAMSASINYAFANRQVIMHWVRESFKKVFGSDDGMDLIYDVCHNLAKVEEHNVDGERRKLIIHRKGATRSFGPGRKEIPSIYRKVGQPVLIPGSMGTASYILVGTDEAEAKSFGSTAHGAGRVMSRHQALNSYKGEDVVKDLRGKGIEVKGASWRGIAEETYQAYKDVDEVVKVSHNVGLGKMVVRVVPLGVIKG